MREGPAQKVAFVVVSTYGTERLGSQVLVAIAKEENFSVCFHSIDLIGETGLIRQMKEVKPDIIAYSAMTWNMVRFIL